ncbi:3-ketoacyl-CoA thiolase B, peroxisomal-like [Babylonia areolata]|uniref:3-ketoacyl-CoA thiolase B, peroxisomal-like n=1 Tax=Babylonia areolata TaxID=304850 RepID=UPI003FD3D75D
MERLTTVFRHLNSPNVVLREVAASTGSFQRKPDDIVVVSALRTPITKAKRGGFKNTYVDDMLTAVFSGVLADTGLSPSDIEDVCVGNVNNPKTEVAARVAQFFSGMPETVPVYSTNRQCASGLQAFMNVAGSLKTGQCNIGIAAGVESMTKSPLGGGSFEFNPRMSEDQRAMDVLIPMGLTSENVAERFGITRQQQDDFALVSQQKAAKAAASGLFDAEIIPVTTTVEDAGGQLQKVTLSKDEGIRPTTIEGLAKLRPAFKEGGTSTAGNSSQVSDGAAAVVVTTRQEAVRRGLPVLGVLRSFAVMGCPPDIMGIGPAVAIPEALKKAGLTVRDIDIFEINEAFASQARYCVEKLGIPADRVNPKGGAIALGHPLGCTGTRMIATLLHELKRRGKPARGVVSMCMGTGMGAAAVFEYQGAN